MRVWLQPGFELEPAEVLRGQKVVNGVLSYPPDGKPTTVPISGTLFVNITATHCNAFGNSHLPLPDGVVLKPHHYFGFRPARTNLYAMFDRRSWAAHLGMGDEPAGWAIAGGSSDWFCDTVVLIARSPRLRASKADVDIACERRFTVQWMSTCI